MAISSDRANVVEATVTRPANTTAYAAGDVVGDGTEIVFSNAVTKAGAAGYILGASIDRTGNETTEPDLELWIFTAAPADKADNAAFAPTDAEIQTVVGVVSFATDSWYDGTAGTGGTTFAMGTILSGSDLAVPPLFEAASGDKDLYGVMVVRNAYTPISAEVFHIKLYVGQV